jgi:agmatine deiminase
MSSDDAWVRDTGPTFVINNSGEVRGVNWDFNAWGGFDGGLYSPWNRDSQVGGKILEIERAATAPKALCWKAVRSTSMAKAR